jgi:hypothetical protein
MGNMKWIPVKDAIESNDIILVTDGHHIGYVRALYLLEDHVQECAIAGITYTNREYLMKIKNVTHWMALPEHPERSKQEDIDCTCIDQCGCVCHGACRWCKH